MKEKKKLITQGQFIKVDFEFVNSKCFRALSPSALKEYLFLRRCIMRAPNDHYYQQGKLATRVSIDTIAEQTCLGKSTITTNHHEMDLEENDLGVMKIENTGRGLVFILGEIKEITDSRGHLHKVEIYYYDHTIRTEKEFEEEEE